MRTSQDELTNELVGKRMQTTNELAAEQTIRWSRAQKNVRTCMRAVNYRRTDRRRVHAHAKAITTETVCSLHKHLCQSCMRLHVKRW